MQIDFHHAVTYVVARNAGFSHDEADKIAYVAQYVDDAIINGTICFNNGAMYTRISSAHKTLDFVNLDNIENHLVWLPFHFLPGNGGSTVFGAVGDHFIKKIVCLPGNESLIANDLLNAALADRGKQNDLHRLGVTMHVYADTWAHQGFAGVINDINKVNDINASLEIDFLEKIEKKAAPALGHGQALTLPDMPFLIWDYKNGDKKISRNNTEFFCAAAVEMCKFMQKYRDQHENGLNEDDAAEMRRLFSDVKDEDETIRHKEWLKAIKKGNFSFGPAEITYDATGENSWKARALGTSDDTREYEYQDAFLASDWKMFHDALQQHRLTCSNRDLI
jgi:hypothetical protein